MRKIFRFAIDITNNCNFDCPYCSLELPYKDSSKSTTKITPKEIKILSLYIKKHLSNFNIDICIRGGEPFLNPYIIDILSEIKRIKNLYGITVLTNGSIPLNELEIDYKSIGEFRISIHVGVLQHNKYFKSIIFNNVEYLLSLKYKPYIQVMKSVDVLQSELLKTYNKVIELFNKYSISTDTVKIVDTFPTKHYKNIKYDYTKIDSLYNNNYNLPVYHCRAIKIKPDFTFKYSCPLASCYTPSQNSIYIYDTWKYILKNINNTTVCDLSTCICPIFCYKY